MRKLLAISGVNAMIWSSIVGLIVRNQETYLNTMKIAFIIIFISTFLIIAVLSHLSNPSSTPPAGDPNDDIILLAFWDYED